jgi:tyrosinase
MKLSASIALAASAIGASATFNHGDFGQFAVDSGLALAGLNGMALVHSANKYGGKCNPGNVKYRREWYVDPTSFVVVPDELT